MTRFHDFGAAMLAYRDRPEGEPEPVKTNWTIVPANQNAAPEEIAEMDVERSWRMTPSVGEIMRQVATSDVEYGAYTDVGGKQHRIVIRIGSLRFSNGTQTERAYTYGPDNKVIRYDAPMPVGAMLGTRDKPDNQLGGSGYTRQQTERSNINMAMAFDVPFPVYKKRGKRKNGKSYTPEESRAILAEAIANTPVMPPVTKCPPALASGGERAIDGFVGLKKGKKGESGMIAWEDVCSSIVQREVWDATLAYLNEQDKQTLDAATTAKTLADIAPGGSLRGARKRGRRMLVAANDNLVAALKNEAA